MSPGLGRSTDPVQFSFARLGCGEGTGPGSLAAEELLVGTEERLL